MKRILISSLFLITFLISSADERPLWMRYPAISPDGQTIVFSYKGDLYTVPAKGGEASILTIHDAYDYAPEWSPDGKYIAFASNRFGSFDLFMIPAEGGSVTRLTSFSLSEIPTDFSPDGKHVLFSALIQDDPDNAQFPTGAFKELYQVPIEGGRPVRVLTTPAISGTYSKDGSKILYYDVKGYENYYRKHHTSSVTRDIWLYDDETKKHTKLTSFKGEDRNPVFSPDETEIYYLSERSGSFNVWSMPLSGDNNPVQLSSYENHPVRNLSISDDGILCFSYNGELYAGTVAEGFSRVHITINIDEHKNDVTFMREKARVQQRLPYLMMASR